MTELDRKIIALVFFVLLANLITQLTVHACNFYTQ